MTRAHAKIDNRPREPPVRREPTIAPIIRSHHDFVWRSLLRLGVPDVLIDDAVEEVFVLSADRLAQPDVGDLVQAWLFAHARRAARRLRKNHEARVRKGDLTGRDVGHSPAPTDDERYKRPPASARLHELLDHLDDERRGMFILAELEGLSDDEVARFVDSDPDTVRMRVFSARSRIEQLAAQPKRPGGRRQ